MTLPFFFQMNVNGPVPEAVVVNVMLSPRLFVELESGEATVVAFTTRAAELVIVSLH